MIETGETQKILDKLDLVINAIYNSRDQKKSMQNMYYGIARKSLNTSA